MDVPRDYAAAPPPPAPTCKHWWHSRTIWVNVIAAGLLALEASTGMLQPLLPVNLYTAIAVGLPVINAMLRIVTSQAIET